ncbi:hydantoinase/oxoprolinase N-terminal domain-containing protein [Paraburkholderia sacchari]|uniref:hydantoinase/oxoprolinase N-terminal domain-containing protein n=1 Tax=Paraburkholderia sacchari TaxID=159450 RepID=UPI0039A71E49
MSNAGANCRPVPARPRVGIDIGGTFTDFVVEAGGVRHTDKRLTRSASMVARCADAM